MSALISAGASWKQISGESYQNKQMAWKLGPRTGGFWLHGLYPMESEGLPLGWKERVVREVLLAGLGRGQADCLAQAPPLRPGCLHQGRCLISHLSLAGRRAPRHWDGMLGVSVRVFPGEHLNL